MGLLDDINNETLAFAMDPDLMPGVETISVQPPSGPARSVRAIVERDGQNYFRALQRVQGMRILITVRNDATYGISSAEEDLTSYRVSVPVRYGATAEDLRVCSKGNPVSQDAGMITLALM